MNTTERRDAKDRARRPRPSAPPRRPIDTASMRARHVVFGGGAFDNEGAHPNRKGWEIFELGQRSFWAVPTAIDWRAEVHELPEYAPAIGAMLGFLCPGEKAAVTGASSIATRVRSEEAQFYFVEQALEEAKHYDALRRLIPMITRRPLEPPSPAVRLLYSFGVIDRDDVAFMMGNINIVGEHIAHQIFHKINKVAVDPSVRKILALIGRDESRHIAAGQRFFPEVFHEYKKSRRTIMAKNVATTFILAVAAHDLVRPLSTLKIDLVDVMDEMYQHYQDVTDGFPPFPDQALLDAIVTMVRRSTPLAIRTIRAMTDDDGRVRPERVLAVCERALSSPRALRDLLA